MLPPTCNLSLSLVPEIQSLQCTAMPAGCLVALQAPWLAVWEGSGCATLRLPTANQAVHNQPGNCNQDCRQHCSYCALCARQVLPSRGAPKGLWERAAWRSMLGWRLQAALLLRTAASRQPAQKAQSISCQNSAARQLSLESSSNQASSGKAAASITASTNSSGRWDSGVGCRGGCGSAQARWGASAAGGAQQGAHQPAAAPVQPPT